MKSFQSFIRAYQARLYHYIIHIIKSREVAEEMVIDVFLKIWQQRESLQEIESFDATCSGSPLTIHRFSPAGGPEP